MACDVSLSSTYDGSPRAVVWLACQCNADAAEHARSTEACIWAWTCRTHLARRIWMNQCRIITTYLKYRFVLYYYIPELDKELGPSGLRTVHWRLGRWHQCKHSPRSAGWWLVLICCERKILLTGWWLVADAEIVWEKNTAGWLAASQLNKARVLCCTTYRYIIIFLHRN
jgi:hypothetical protein